MKLAIDCRMSGKSGIGTFFDGILPHLYRSIENLVLIGFDDEVIEAKKSLFQNARFISCSIKMFSIKELFNFPKDILREINECDAYFTPYCNIPGGIKVPVYSTIHDVVFLDVKGLASTAGTFARKLFYKNAITKSRCIFTVSEFSSARIKKQLRCKKDICVVYNGIPAYLETPVEPKPEKDSSIIYIGNIKKHKGLSILLGAYEKFLSETSFQQGEKPVLLVVGKQDNFRSSDDLAGVTISRINEAYPDSIKFTGFIGDEDLKVLIAKSRFLVQPSLYEGFGIPPLQALYMGTKALISDIPVFKEIYEGFPVTFFKSEDIDDLASKMDSLWNSKESGPDPKDIPQKYSYEATAKLILNKITKSK